MKLGIKPTNDFAFKKIFGSPENSESLIGLLNAILDLEHQVTQVEIKNPFSMQEFQDDKLVVLDLRCCDSLGRWFNVEMQVSNVAGLLQRLVFYACDLYSSQMSTGGNYAALQPAISICLLGANIFPEPQAHHRFRLVDTESGRELPRGIEVHTVEMLKYNLDESTIRSASKLEQWAFLLLRAQDYDAETLRELLPGIEFGKAIGTIEVISAKTENKQMYDQREKAKLDQQWLISSARDEGIELGMEKGREEGREEGRKATVIETLIMLEELLGVSTSDPAKLEQASLAELTDQVSILRKRLRDRQS